MYKLNPLRDPRWMELVHRHELASVFHTPEWLEALRRTYGYEPVVVTTSPPGRDLTNGILVCSVKSWLTGWRLVSAPFSDHCDPLVDDTDAFDSLLFQLKQEAAQARYKYIEFRPLDFRLADDHGLSRSGSFLFHEIDLQYSEDEIFSTFHKSCVQRKIQRAERERLLHEVGNSPELVQKFYELQVKTRHTKGLPPQPASWFRNLAASMGSNLQIQVVSRDSKPIAAILALRFRRTLIYKYGCSDKQFSHVGGTQLLFWKAIKDAKREGFTTVDMGRTDLENDGLIAFKERFGARPRPLTYWKYCHASYGQHSAAWTTAAAKKAFSHMPDRFLTVAGTLLYRHFA